MDSSSPSACADDFAGPPRADDAGPRGQLAGYTAAVVDQYRHAIRRGLEIDTLDTDVFRVGDVEIGEQSPAVRHVLAVAERPQACDRDIAAELEVADYRALSCAPQLLTGSELSLREPGEPHPVPPDLFDTGVGSTLASSHIRTLDQEAGVVDRCGYPAAADLQPMPIGAGNRDVAHNTVARAADNDNAVLAAVPGDHVPEGKALDVLQCQLVRSGSVVARVGAAGTDDFQPLDGQAPEWLAADRRGKEDGIDLAGASVPHDGVADEDVLSRSVTRADEVEAKVPANRGHSLAAQAIRCHGAPRGEAHFVRTIERQIDQCAIALAFRCLDQAAHRSTAADRSSSTDNRLFRTYKLDPAMQPDRSARAVNAALQMQGAAAPAGEVGNSGIEDVSNIFTRREAGTCSADPLVAECGQSAARKQRSAEKDPTGNHPAQRTAEPLNAL